jgi:hypothetical protein
LRRPSTRHRRTELSDSAERMLATAETFLKSAETTNARISDVRNSFARYRSGMAKVPAVVSDANKWGDENEQLVEREVVSRSLDASKALMVITAHLILRPESDQIHARFEEGLATAEEAMEELDRLSDVDPVKDLGTVLCN